MINRKILLNPDELVHGISNFVEITSFADLKEHMDLMQSEEMYGIELFVENDEEIDTFFATGYAHGKNSINNSRVYEVEFLFRNREYKFKEVQFEELSTLVQQLLNNEKIDLSEWESQFIGNKKINYDEILTVKYLKKSNLMVYLAPGFIFVAVFLMMFIEANFGLVVSFVVGLFVSIAVMLTSSPERLMNMVNKQEKIIGYKIDQVFANKDFKVGDYYSERRIRNRDFFIDIIGEVLLLRECVDTISFKRRPFSKENEKNVSITLVNGAKIRVRLSPDRSEEIQRWFDM